jgi:hypothetical protein
MSLNLAQHSRDSWVSSPDPNKPTNDDLKLGCLQRIASAVEKMASSYDQMRADRDMYKRWYEEEKTAKDRQCKSNNSLRGYITRLKRGMK